MYKIKIPHEDVVESDQWLDKEFYTQKDAEEYIYNRLEHLYEEGTEYRIYKIEYVKQIIQD